MMVKMAMPAVKASTAARRLPSGIAIGAKAPTISPTPATVNSAPRLASSCGRIIAQPTPSARRRPSCIGATKGGRSHSIRTEVAMRAPRPRLMSVTCLGSTSPGNNGKMKVPASATPGMIRAGRNSRLPWRETLARRSAMVVVAAWPLPGAPSSASATSSNNNNPLPVSPKASPARNSTASRPQKQAPSKRFVCCRSSRVATAQLPNTSPASV